MPTTDELDARVTELERQMSALNRLLIGDGRPRSERPLEPTLIEQISDMLDARFAASDLRMADAIAASEQRTADAIAASEQRTAKTIEELLRNQKAEIIDELKS